MNILLVSGHGDGDPGACANGFKEADLTRDVAARLCENLKMACSVTVFDKTKNMYQYQKKYGNIDFKNYDLVLEIHFNAGGGEGSEILTHTNSCSKKTDELILKNLSSSGFKNRGVKKRSDLYNMNVCYKQDVPYSLLELCFIDSAGDMKLYAKNKSKIISSIADGIKEAYNLKKTELTQINDIVWELSHRGIISNTTLWLGKLANDANSYWLARKTVQFFRANNL